MGVFFFSESRQVLHSRANTYARAFWEMTRAACAYYNVKMVLTPIEDDECTLDEEGFCFLVELAFDDPRALFYPWARYAAGIYERVKGERYTWVWKESELPVQAVHVVRRSGHEATRTNGRVIGRVNK